MILGLIQARASSTRLPRKVLLPVLDSPMLARQIERVKLVQTIHEIQVVTSTDSSDDEIEQLCNDLGVKCFRGSLDDVLDRFYQAASQTDAFNVVRITGDCPLIDPGLIDEVIGFHLLGSNDYSSNAVEPTFPDGLDTEVFKFSVLEKTWKEAKKDSEREHVTSYIYKNPDTFKIGHYKSETDLSAMRWTVDTEEDYKFICKIYQHLYPTKKHFNYMDVLDLLEKKPELKEINSMYQRNEGYKE